MALKTAVRYSWKQVALNSLTTLLARSSHAISSVGDKVYLIGGEHVARTPIDSTVYEYSLATDAWEEVQITGGEPPEQRIAHSQAVVGQKIYIFGGRQGIHMSEKPLNDMHCFDTSTSKWERVSYTGGEPPAARSFHKMTSVGSILYVFGGCAAAGRQKDLHSFDTLTGVWTALQTSPEIAGRGGPSLAAVCTDAMGSSSLCDSLLVTAGFSGQENNDMHLYNIATNTWAPSVTLPYRARSVCPTTTIAQNRYVVMFGGEVNTSDRGHEGAGDFASDLVCIDSATGAVVECTNTGTNTPPARGWTEMTTMLPAAAAAATTLTTAEFLASNLMQSYSQSYSVLLCGGLTGNDENPQRLNDTWLLTVTVDMTK